MIAMMAMMEQGAPAPAQRCAPFNMRMPRSEDMAFIYSTWLTSVVENQKNYVHRGYVRRKLRHIIDRVYPGIIVATAIDDDSQIYGYICREGYVVHYVYVKQLFRRMGIGRRLLLGNDAEGEHRYLCTQWSDALCSPDVYRRYNLSYDPYYFVEY